MWRELWESVWGESAECEESVEGLEKCVGVWGEMLKSVKRGAKGV